MDQRDINSRTRADTFGLRPDLYDALSGNMVKKDDLEALIPYSGECFSNSGSQFAGNGFISFGTESAPMYGCHLTGDDNGGITFDEIGQWRVDVSIVAHNTQAVVYDTEIRIEISDSDDNLIERRAFKQRPAPYGMTRITLFSKFVIAEAGHKVRVYVLGPSSGLNWKSGEYALLSVEYKYPGVA